MFLALKNGLGRLAVFFRGLFDEYGGAAAAYSLRRLGSAYSGPLVRVRRDSDDAELDFTSTTQIADWVNGKQETTLPADVDTASAAFSLRKVKAGYTGDAVRIRRASDDVEVNVAFDTNGAVSASSPITNVPEEFLSNDFTDGWVEEAGATIVDSNTFTTSANAQGISLAVANGKKLKITVAGTATGASYRIYDWSDGGIKATLSGTFSTTVEFTTVGNQNKIYFRSTAAGTLDVTSLTIEVINDAGGDTTATTLGGFLTEELTAYSSDFTTTDGWFESSTLITANVDANADGAGVPPSDDFLKMVANNRLSIRGNADVNNYVIGAGGGDFEVTFDYYAPQDISSFKIITFTGSGSPQFGDNDQIVTGSGSWSTTVTLTDAQATTLTDFRVGSTTDQTGKTLYIKNLQIKRSNHNAYVHTWYDQSGSGNDATQNTSGDQPKIAEAGALLADGIDFDGSDDKLNFTALSASDLSIFSVVTFDSVAGQERIIGPQSGANEGFGIGNATTGFFRGSGGAANSPTLNATISADTATLYSLIRASNTGTFFTDSTASATFSNTDTFAGASLGGATNPVDGSLKEIIIYTSDQTSNRFKIESNINNHYGIYTASHNGFVSIWYDQSGNGTDATQSSLPEQPKIVQSGVLVTTLGEPSINFAVGQLLFTDSLIVSLSTNSASVFAVSSQSSLSTTTSYVLQEPDSNISSNFIMGGVANNGVLWVNATEFGTMQTGQTLSGFDWNQSTFQAHINGAASGASGTATVNAEFGSRTGIGGFGGGVGRFQGFMQEIITYKSDQSANRSGIESNIAEHYGITLP